MKAHAARDKTERLDCAFEGAISPNNARLFRSRMARIDVCSYQCIDWIAHGFELVQSILPGWKFAPADTIAAFGLHGALIVGPRHVIGSQPEAWLNSLSAFEIELYRNETLVARGHASDVPTVPC